MPDSHTATTKRQPQWPAILRVFAPAAPAETMLTDPAEIKAQYRYWQRRILFSTIVGYAMFYFVRKNLSVAMPAMLASTSRYLHPLTRASPRRTIASRNASIGVWRKSSVSCSCA